MLPKLPKLPKKEKIPDAGELYGVLAEFEGPGELIDAAKEVRGAGYEDWDCYSPFPVHGIDPAMGIQMTILPWVVFLAGLGGLGGGLLLQWWTNAEFWPWLVSGKPAFSLPANVPITFETTILASVLTTFFAMWIFNGLPQVWHPFFRSDRFARVTDDGFFVGILASDERFDRGATVELLKKLGANEVEMVHIDPDPAKKKMPVGIYGLIVVSTAIAIVPFALVANARASKSREPHYHLIPDMDFQAKLKAQKPTDFLGPADMERIAIPGAVERDAQQDDVMTTGVDGGQWARTFPTAVNVDKEFIELGERRFLTYCSPCHGVDGKGNGIIHERTKVLGTAIKGWSAPKNLTDPQYVTAPHGQIFNIISHGTANQNMLGYASQISPHDRWAIVAYLRALQLSQNATAEDFQL